MNVGIWGTRNPPRTSECGSSKEFRAQVRPKLGALRAIPSASEALKGGQQPRPKAGSDDRGRDQATDCPFGDRAQRAAGLPDDHRVRLILELRVDGKPAAL